MSRASTPPRLLWLLCSLQAVGCAADAEEPFFKPRPTAATSTQGTLSTEPTASTGTTGTEELATFDCSTVPDQPGASVPLDAPRAYNDVVFDVDGGMVGWDGQVLLKATDPDTFAVHAPGIDMVYKLGQLPGGDLVAASQLDEVLRIEPNGNSYPIAVGVNGYGLAVGSDGMVYVGTNNSGSSPAGIVRIDPDTQDRVTIAELDATPPRDFAFSRDYSALYFGTRDGGDVFKLPLDANLDPSGPPELLVTVPATWHDTVEVDACGNIYVGGLFGEQYYRINPDLSVDVMINFTFENWAHGFDWGDPTGGWDELSIYMAHPDIGNRVDEVYLGVPGAHWEGVVIGGVTI